jgi:casein kinase II subunit alpha
MGRSSTKSVARVYADINARLGSTWHEYGQCSASTFINVTQPESLDNLQVQWGSQDHYEIVRKVGRGKYSEVRTSRLFRRSNLTTRFRFSRV